MKRVWVPTFVGMTFWGGDGMGFRDDSVVAITYVFASL
jgi:hypothetical protein